MHSEAGAHKFKFVILQQSLCTILIISQIPAQCTTHAFWCFMRKRHILHSITNFLLHMCGRTVCVFETYNTKSHKYKKYDTIVWLNNIGSILRNTDVCLHILFFPDNGPSLFNPLPSHMAYILFPLAPCLLWRSPLCKAVVSKYCEWRHQTAYCVAIIRVANWCWNKCLYSTVPSSIIIKSWSPVLTKVTSNVLQIGTISMKKLMSLQTLTLEDNYLLHGDMFVMVTSLCHISTLMCILIIAASVVCNII